MNCAGCKIKQCYLEGKDCIDKRDSIAALYRGQENSAIMTASAEVEVEGYASLTRVEELIEFSKKMGYRRLGIAFCVGCADEAKTLQEILESTFLIESVCCKVCGINKSEFNLKTIRKAPRQTICNPLGQAALLNEAETELNILVGLCLGHDMLFTKHSSAPVTTLLVKDRVMANNPAGVLCSPYWKHRLLEKK